MPAVAAITEAVPDVPPPLPRMTEAEATAVLQAYAASHTELEDRLEAAMTAEDYEACDAINVEIEKLDASKDAAAAVLGDRAATAGMTKEEAEAVIAAHTAALTDLEGVRRPPRRPVTRVCLAGWAAGCLPGLPACLPACRSLLPQRPARLR